MAVVKRTSDNVLLDTALKNFYAATEEMGLEDGLVEILSRSERKTCVSIPVEMDDGTVKVFDGFRVAHSSAVGPAKGGVRFHPEVCLDECEALAFMMTWKCSLAGIPYGGGKGGVCCNPLEISPKEKERICRTFAARIEPVVGAWTDIPAPDVNTGGQEMVWFMDTISKMRGRLEPAIFTGKPIPLWGSKGRNAATGLGVATCAIELMNALDKPVKGATVAVQGFGNVGTFAALTMIDAGAKVVAISDITGTYYCKDGLDIKKAFDHVSNHPKKLLEGFEQPGLEKRDLAALVTTECDILLPCALEGAINGKNADEVKAKYIVEGANGPITPEADAVLDGKGILVVPDFLANSGGVIGSYFEWCQDLGGFFWTQEDYNNRLLRIMKDNFKTVWDYSQSKNVKMRRAAFMAAIQRVADAVKMRGVFM
ncbi:MULTISPECIES: Glu/Leu/Phe/Val family dehydrogenase [Dethiosulfovibrio]|jgi:glutamate dehydrogenase (NAD(P)+)|uniref:Glutamate dehydrogenase n=2 Tax=Dethiosulfovibrio TaxID=47054 RepID=A0ABS9ENU8_9BACT|nr:MULTISPECIES: Glu/Leu/Phe/Val dehydrogenase [Dethiosulfovibrio]MCF4114650.1 Glu/Leu/Phe/Val dehydrogenase [Dethiosulfovibrio russensis]MCF4142874.1 Glu/Leu/Phe/Val dehydrogenase [Dethiosulfovibrio marinus]MCF4144797.1 Glu/Leu/Phe/Val dehydrogenase [Dethiosulfovibrio acidaminovorans]